MEPDYRCRIILLDFGHPMKTNTITNIINSLENILALSFFSKNPTNFGILSLGSKLILFQSRTNSQKNYDLVIKNLRTSSKKTYGKVTVQEYKVLLRSSIETALAELQEKNARNYGNKPSTIPVQFAIITEKFASILDDILNDLTNKLQNTFLNNVSVENFKIVQILSELPEKYSRAPEKNRLIDWAICLDDINNLSCFFKDWLLNPQQKLRILLSSDPNLEINCDVYDCILNPISFSFDRKSDLFNQTQLTDSKACPGDLKQVYNLEVMHRLPVNGFCPTLVFGFPRRIYATRSSSLNETDLQKNSKMFKELCRELQKTGQGLLAKSLLSEESNELIFFHFLTSDGNLILMNDVAPDELYLPKRTKLSKFVDFSEDGEAASMIKSCFQKIEFLDEYTPENFCSGVYDYLKNYLIQAEQNKSVIGYSNIKLFEQNKGKKENLNMSCNTIAFTSNAESLTSTVCEKRKRRPKPGSEKELQNVHPALLSPNIVGKYRKIHSQAFALPELGKEYNNGHGKKKQIMFK